ncbi:MAG: HAD family hydrolase [Kiritimatiellia bacterium]
MFGHWFFDLDGTLAQTGEDIVAAWKAAIRSLGRDLSRFDEVFRIGPPLEQIVYDLFDDATPELVAELVAAFKPRYDCGGFPNTAPYPGVPELLAAIRRAGGKTYVVTNKRHAATQLIARKFGWDRLMDGVWSYDTFGTGYGKPALLAKLLKDLGVAAEAAVMVGDTKGDVDAGKANGVATVGVTYGYGTPEEVASADLVFDSAFEIAKKLVK